MLAFMAKYFHIWGWLLICEYPYTRTLHAVKKLCSALCQCWSQRKIIKAGKGLISCPSFLYTYTVHNRWNCAGESQIGKGKHACNYEPLIQIGTKLVLGIDSYSNWHFFGKIHPCFFPWHFCSNFVRWLGQSLPIFLCSTTGGLKFHGNMYQNPPEPQITRKIPLHDQSEAVLPSFQDLNGRKLLHMSNCVVIHTPKHLTKY